MNRLLLVPAHCIGGGQTHRIITTINDLRIWVDHHAGRDMTMTELEQIAQAIRTGDHPAWGTNWSEFLSNLPALETYL